MPKGYKPKNSGRKRTVFCESCLVKPIPVKTCRPCQNIYERNLRATDSEYHQRELARRRKFYAEHKEYEMARKKKWKESNKEKTLERERTYKDKSRYGDFAEAHRVFLTVKRQIKGSKNETSSN